MMMLLALFYAFAQDLDVWLNPDGPSGLSWGTAVVPLDAVQRRRDLYLPDSNFLGAAKETPVDLEITAPLGERRYLRYVQGQLVDAWWLANHALDVTPLVSGDPSWSGIILGPALEEGWLAYGVARSWTIGSRTVLHWKDKQGELELIATRAAPTMQYGINRPSPLAPARDTGHKVKISGAFSESARNYTGELASCFDNTRTPVEAVVQLRLDGYGYPARIRVEADQPVTGINECLAGTLLFVQGEPGQSGTMRILRFK